METVLLTGGMGYIGSHTAVELLREGYDVIIADDLSNSSADVLDRIEKITGIRPVFYQVDAADKKAMEPVFRDHPISAVIHFAGFKAVGESVARPLMYYRNNIDSALTVLELMKKYDVQRFIFSSSATVYGEHNVPPLTEDLPTGGRSALRALCADWRHHESLRPDKVHDRGDPEGCRESGSGTFRRAASLL